MKKTSTLPRWKQSVKRPRAKEEPNRASIALSMFVQVSDNGKNNRTKTMMRQAYGYRHFQQLRLRILSGGEG